MIDKEEKTIYQINKQFLKDTKNSIPLDSKTIIDQGVNLDTSKLRTKIIEEPLKRKRGRPKGYKKTAELILPDKPSEIYINAVKIPFDLWADATKTEELRLTTGQAQKLSLAIEHCLVVYMPQIPSKHLVLFNLGIMLTTVITPRIKLMADRTKVKDEPTK